MQCHIGQSGYCILAVALLCWVQMLVQPSIGIGRKVFPLDRQQQAVLGTALDEAHREGATPKEIKALIEALIVESNIHNLPYGSADSVGALQQRPSQGWHHAMNVRGAVRDFLAAARPLRNQYQLASGLAQGVQRSAFPSRYQGAAQEADALANQYGGQAFARQTGAGGFIPSNNGSQRDAIMKRVALARYLQQADPSSMLLKLGVVSPNEQVPALKANMPSTTGQISTSGTSSITGAKHGLYELFWQGPGGIDIKNGQPVAQGFVEGHTDHVHVASDPATIVKLGHLAQQMGLKPTENPHFGGVTPGAHVKDSYHYKGEAIDVVGSPQQMRQYAHQVARIFGIH